MNSPSCYYLTWAMLKFGLGINAMSYGWMRGVEGGLWVGGCDMGVWMRLGGFLTFLFIGEEIARGTLRVLWLEGASGERGKGKGANIGYRNL